MADKIEICKRCGDSLTKRDGFWYSTQKNTRVCGDTVVQGMHVPSEVSGHYRATVTCTNCDTPNTLMIPKGTTVIDHLVLLGDDGDENLYYHNCEYCGCELEDINEIDG